MHIKLVETNLNLRIEKGKSKDDYTLSKEIAEKQLSILDADIYANVEYMECRNSEYLQTFKNAGYKNYISTDLKGRGILCSIRNSYVGEIIGEMSTPHMLHMRIKKSGVYFDLIIIRLLVSSGNLDDYVERAKQWKKILEYIDNFADKSHLIITGDFNHGVICDSSDGYLGRPREKYNYQMVVEDLAKKAINLHPMLGYSYRGFMKLDHIATGQKIMVDSAKYEDYKKVFGAESKIGTPDHNCIVANISCIFQEHFSRKWYLRHVC